MPKKTKPNHWKGDNGLYCTGFSGSGLSGISYDAKMIAEDIASTLINQEFRNYEQKKDKPFSGEI